MAKEEATLLLKIKQAGAKTLDKVKDGLDKIKFASIAAAAAAIAFVAKSVAAYKVQEEAVNRLNQAMVNNGDFTAEASQDLQNFAAELQKSSKFGDETIISMLSLAKSFGVSNEEAKKMIQAATDLSSATGMELESAVKNLGKTFAGMTGELGESVPALRGLTAEQLKSGAAIDLVAEKFKGSNAAVVDGLGALDQMTNSFGDLMEVVGKAFAPVVVHLAKAMNTLTSELSNSETTSLALEAVVDTLVESYIQLTNGVEIAGQVLGTVMAATWESLGELVSGNFSKAKEIATLGMEEVGNILVEGRENLDLRLEEMALLKEEQDNARRARELQQIEMSNKNKVKLEKKHNLEMKKEAKRVDLEDKKRKAEQQIAEIQFTKTKVDIATAGANLISAVAGRESKVAFLISRAAAIAQSIVQTNLAATQAYAASIIPGDPTSPFRAAAISANVRAAGVLNTAAIAATTIQGLEDGGIVPATSGGTIARIGEGNRDEAVVPLDSFGGGVGTTVNLTINGGLLGDQETARDLAVAIDQALLDLRKANESVAFDSGVI